MQRTSFPNVNDKTCCCRVSVMCKDFLGLTAEDIMQASQRRQSCSDAGGVPGFSPASAGMLTLHGGGGLGGGVYRKPVGSVRLSLGYLSTFDDVDTVVSFVSSTYLW